MPDDWKHLEKYPLTAETAPDIPVPVVIGVNWYSDFDRPIRDSKGRYWIGRDSKKLGFIRGGHCVCIPASTLDDEEAWRIFYNQGKEGACVGFGASRMMSLLNRRRYDAKWLWNEAKAVDEWPETRPGDTNGTSVRAALDVLKARGHRRVRGGRTSPEALGEGISAFRWAKNVSDVLLALKNPAFEAAEAVPILNSWGKGYPHVVWLPLATLERLIREDGEVGLVTDR